MYSVTVCVILVIVGNVSSFVHSRNRRDMEQTILDVYGPPNIPRQIHHHPHHMPLKPNHNTMKDDVEEPKVHIPQEVLDNIFGPPIKSKPESSAPHFYSAISETVKNRRLKEVKDLQRRDKTEINLEGVQEAALLRKDVANIFDSSAHEAMNATDNSTASNGTGTFDYDDRFLSETLLRTQWINNREKSEQDTAAIQKHAEKPEAHLQPESPKREQLEPTKELRPLDPGPTEHRQKFIPLKPVPLDSKPLEPRSSELTPSTSLPNASSKNSVSQSLVIVLVYFCLQCLVFI